MGLFGKIFGTSNNEKQPPKANNSASAVKATKVLPRAEEVNLEILLQEPYNTAVANFGHENCENMFEADQTEAEYYAPYRSMDMKTLWGKAESGNRDAQYVLADALAEKNQIEEAIKWFQKSADQKNGDALLKLGQFYLYGFGFKQDVKKAEQYLLQSCYNGALYRAAMLLTRIHAQIDTNAGFDSFKESTRWSTLAAIATGYYRFKNPGFTYSQCAIGRYMNAKISMGALNDLNESYAYLAMAQKMMDDALIAHHYEMNARLQDDYQKERAVDICSVLELIGYGAEETDKDYAGQVLAVAASMGSDYAAALAVLDAEKKLQKSANPKKANEELRKDPLFQEYCRRAKRATRDNRSEGLQGIASYTAFLICANGEDGREDLDAAVEFLENACKLGNQPAKKRYASMLNS